MKALFTALLLLTACQQTSTADSVVPLTCDVQLPEAFVGCGLLLHKASGGDCRLPSEFSYLPAEDRMPAFCEYMILETLDELVPD